MRSRAYWIARAAALEAALQNAAAEVTAETVEAYERAIEAINADIRDTFSAYVANDIPDGEAAKLLDAAASDKTYAELMQMYAETTDVERRADILARVNAQAYGARISRLEGVKSRILIEMTRAANAALTAHKTLYTKTLQKSYYTTVYNIAEGLNCGVDFSLLPTRAINAALREPWNGVNYSDRVWNHNDRFTAAVQNTVTTGITAGHSVNHMAAQLEEYARSESADGVLYSTTRLVRTETAHFMNTGQKAAYDEIGIKKYRFVAALSERTCETCGALDGQVFEVKAAREGVNYPPIHPNCRCTTVMADAISKTRIARDPKTGKNYKVDGDMTFEEWKAGLTDEQRAAMETHVRQMQNNSADKKQYERYTKVLGDSAPKSFDKFVEIKYNDDRSKYEKLKTAYADKGIQNRIRNSYNLTIHEGRQGKHIFEHNNYIAGRSYLTVSMSEAQELVNQYAGTGEIQRDRQGKWSRKELVSADKIIGKAVEDSGVETETSRFIIHYSKKGTHIVPTTRNFRSD